MQKKNCPTASIWMIKYNYFVIKLRNTLHTKVNSTAGIKILVNNGRCRFHPQSQVLEPYNSHSTATGQIIFKDFFKSTG